MAPPRILRVKWTPAEWGLIQGVNLENVAKFGGFQQGIARIMQRTNRETLECDIRPQDLAGIRKKAHGYGYGTYNRVYQAIEAAVARVVDKN